MNCQTESVVRLCVRYAEQLSVFEEFTVLDILGDISVDQISDSTLYYICEKFYLLVLQNNVMGVKIIENNMETVCEVKYKKMF
ncbi:hypothetical protein CD116_08060 [Staphylococcus schweitzeri]|uniref:Uncharacterized protein n=1 Tax=Staphylococcus schweitzeri TaxID=1654388 RepID=A0A2K4AGQ5_9STAP|nr:hypothetical protein [Staphylococcus schweitzeri]MBE2127743.1 hypothetical protein [Staphylococcus schweitzeri]PNZ49118.1 hypothetical protein CD116_08060 [Staphylococcus schweitzeri]CDR53516.1 hypothetical protein ERS140266_00823 [Staphylococcus schweitzeri]VEE66066.1 Uncharacterised protein [Staphylococcus schweitzeri]